MLQLRMIVPDDESADVVDALVRDDRVTGVVVQPGAGRRPEGDLVSCDVPPEAADVVMDLLRRHGVDRRGSIEVITLDSAPSADMEAAELAAPGAPDDVIVWSRVRDMARDAARETWSFYLFLCLATLIASVSVVTDSSILVVGAMVVGPEFALVAAMAVGLILREGAVLGRALRTLVQGFVLAIVVGMLLALVARAIGWIDLATVTGPRPLTGFIWRPDRWSVVVAVLAGIVGVLSYTSERGNTLVGVFISVTTVPAAGDMSLSLAVGAWRQVGASALQLGVNIAGMLLAGVLTLVIQRAVWNRFARPQPVTSGPVARTHIPAARAGSSGTDVPPGP